MQELLLRGLRRLTFLSMIFGIFLEAGAQQRESGFFSIKAENAQSISIDQTFTKSTTITPFGRSAPIYGLDMSADIKLDHYNFVSTTSFDPVKTSVPGIAVCGAFESPIDIQLPDEKSRRVGQSIAAASLPAID